MQIKCCDCGCIYTPRYYTGEGITDPFIECPGCGLRHIAQFIPFRSGQSQKQEVQNVELASTYYADLGGSRILSIDGTTDHSGADDADVTDWVKSTEFIVACNIHSSGKDTEASTYKLQWQDDTDTSGYTDLAASGEMDYTISDSSWSHGDTVATGDQVCDSQGGDTRQAGERIKNQSLSDSVDLPDEYQTELWFGINSEGADDSHQYSFRLYSSAEGAVVGVLGATIAMEAVGNDAISGASTITFTNAADIQGTGRIQTAPDITFTNAAIIKGFGQVKASSDITVTDAANIDGRGRIQAAPDITFTDVAIIKGIGSIHTAPDIIFSIASIIKGVGRVQASSDITFTNSAAIVDAGGSDEISGSSDITFTDAAILKGIGNIVAVNTIAYINAAILKGIGDVSAESNISFSIITAIKGVGNISAASSISFTDAAIIKGIGLISAKGDIVYTNTANIVSKGYISAQGDIQFTDLASVISRTALAAQSVPVFSTVSSLTGGTALTGNAGIDFSTASIIINTDSDAIVGIANITCTVSSDIQGIGRLLSSADILFSNLAMLTATIISIKTSQRIVEKRRNSFNGERANLPRIDNMARKLYTAYVPKKKYYKK